MFIILIIIMLKSLTVMCDDTLLMTEKTRKKINDRYDILHVRHAHQFFEDFSEKMIVKPEGEQSSNYDLTAQSPPVVKFFVIDDLEPEYFNDPNEQGAFWALWNIPTKTEDGRFVFAVSDHKYRNAKLYIKCYRVSDDSIYTLVDIGEKLGWTDSMYTDGKIHCELGIMKDGTLWGGTHYGSVMPETLPDNTNYSGSWLFSYNIDTGEFFDWGVPLKGNTLPLMRLDEKRGMLFGTGFLGTVVCWDVINKKILYSGYPPNGYRWWRRACLLDTDTGVFWSTDSGSCQNNSLFDDICLDHHLLSYDPASKTFTKHEMETPENPYTGKNERIRAYTSQKAVDGAYYCITLDGTFFKLWPKQEKVESIGVNWNKGCYTTTMAIDPSGRFIYYMPGDDGIGNVANAYGPVVQYDVTTGKKKVLAWLVDYYHEKYGYQVGGTYGMTMSGDGSFLFITMNGAFGPRVKAPTGNPSIFIITIPESERSMGGE